MSKLASLGRCQQSIKAFIAQQLIPTVDGQGRRAAIEILINTPLVSDLIFKGEVHQIREVMKKSRELGMMTFDQALFDLVETDQISVEDALRNADSVNDLRLAIKLQGKDSRDRDLSSGTQGLGIV